MPERTESAKTRIQSDEVLTPGGEAQSSEELESEAIFAIGKEPLRASFDASGEPIAEADDDSIIRSTQARAQPYEPPYESGELEVGQRADDPESDTGHKTADPTDALPPEDAA